MRRHDAAVGKVLDQIEALAETKDRVALGEIVEALGSRSYGPFVLIPALIDISPIGSIPTLPTVLASAIILFAVQMLLGRTHMWLPGFLSRRSISAERIGKSMPSLRKMAKFLDRWFHGRIPAMTRGIWLRLSALCVIGLALTVPPLELLPLATTAPMAAIGAFGLALLVGDGLLMILAYLAASAAVAIGFSLVGKN